MKNLRQIAKSIKNNLGGWITNRKIIVIESDDWGSIRIPDLSTLNKLRQFGFKVDDCAYMLNDTLESDDDMNHLFDVLEKLPKRVVITANFLTSNPNFDKIRNSNFEHYFNEDIRTTLSNYPKRGNVYNLYLEGLEKKIFYPQLHGREHLNVKFWMRDLKEDNTETKFAFDHGICGVSQNVVRVRRESYQATFSKLSEEKDMVKDILQEASVNFNNLFGFNSKTFIAPNYNWSKVVENELNNSGIKYIQGGNRQVIETNMEKKAVRNLLGSTNVFGQKYLIRNVSFEPFHDTTKDWVDDCLNQIKYAFLLKKPAVITMHRVNFVGGINLENRARNLKLLDTLLRKIISKWPEVEFLNSEELGNQL